MEYEELSYICLQVILPIFVSVGLVVNVVAFCVWVFGQKSKSLCCAIYFAANSAVDFLFLTRPLLWHSADLGWYGRIIPKTDVTCKLSASFYISCVHLTIWISAIITVERSLTILFPFVFKSQNMRKRSKIVLAVIIVLQPFIQFTNYYYIIRKPEVHGICIYSSGVVAQIYKTFEAFAVIFIPFAVILTFNVATVATLIMQRSKRQSVNGRRDHVNVFTKLTLLTGLSFCLSYALYVVILMDTLIGLGIDDNMYMILSLLFGTMHFFNSTMNPILCYVVCKSVRDDIKHFIRAIAQRIRRCCTCGCSQREIPTPNDARDTPAFDNIELTHRNAGTRCLPKVETTSV